MALLQVILLLALLLVCSIAPGFFFLRRLRWATTEILCASIGLSLILIYLYAGTVYCTRADWRWCWLFTGASLAAILVSWPDVRRFLRRHTIHRQLGGFVMLLGLGLLLLSLIAHYSGGSWAADWTEHYQRTHFFLKRLPMDMRFINVYPLPSRPPFMHLIGAFFQAQAGDGFDLFQVITLFLNVLVFFPCVLIAGQLTLYGPRRIGLIAGMLATCPLFLQNVTWAWNKQFAAFFVILSIAFYIRGWRKPSTARMIAAAISMAAAILVHYSAAPYALFLLIHYLWSVVRKRSVLEPLASASVASLLLFTWFGWSIAHYGLRPTFESNTTITDSSGRTSIEQAGAVFRNLAYTVIPHPLRQSLDAFDIEYAQPNAFAHLRDWWFNLYQTNLPVALGSAGWLLVPWLIYEFSRRGDRSVRRFWMQLAAFVIPLGIAVIGSVEMYGVTHVCLQPLVLLGRVTLAAGWPYLRRWGRALLAISLVMDACLGIMLQFRIEMLRVPVFIREGIPVVPLSNGLPNPQAIINSFSRVQFGFVFLADHFRGFEWAAVAGVIVILSLNLFRIARAGSTRGGWVFPAVVAALFLGGSIACLADRAAGYSVNAGVISPENPTAADYEVAAAPLRQAIQARSPAADDHFNLARLAYEYGRLDQAVVALRDTLLLDPDYVPGRNLAGILILVNHVRFNPEDVLSWIVLRTWAQDEAHYVRYGATLGIAGFTDKCRAVLADAVRRYPESVPAHANFGSALLATGETDRAIAEFEWALRRSPGSDEIAQRLREALSRRGDAPDAIDEHLRKIRGGG